MIVLLRQALERDEDNRRYPYVDTRGNITIGIGRNLTGIGLLPSEVDLCYNHDAQFAEVLARQLFPKFDDFGDVRQAALCNMCFNLGSKIREFVKFIGFVNLGQWEQAAVEMLDSLWAAQVGERAKRLAYSMRSNKL